MVENEKVIVKMVDDSACEVIGTGAFNVIERDGIVCALEAVLEVRYNLISIRVLDKEECQIQVQ